MTTRFVARLDGDMAVKVILGDQSNHHAALEFLAVHVPDIPIPRPHGLIQLGSMSLLFTSYVPKQTLANAWPVLTLEEKLSLTDQLESMLKKIRKIDRQARRLGLLNGQGVVDTRGWRDEFRPNDTIQTVAEFEDFFFSYKPWVSENYIRFLKSFLPPTRFEETCVFTHTDFRPANIMVDVSAQGHWTITGIIDWEDSGFYPAYWEAVKSTRTFLANNGMDWYLMQPPSIAPSRYSEHWLVDRLWESMIEEFRRVDRDPRIRKAEAERQAEKERIWRQSEKKIESAMNEK